MQLAAHNIGKSGSLKRVLSLVSKRADRYGNALGKAALLSTFVGSGKVIEATCEVSGKNNFGINNFSTNQAYDKDRGNDKDFQKVTVKALIHEMNLKQMESSATLVPWFFDNFPSSYFRQIEDELQKQHLNVIIAARELGQSDLTIKMNHVADTGRVNVTYLSVHGSEGSDNIGGLHSQIKSLEAPEGFKLSRVKVFSSQDRSISLNIFCFDPSDNNSLNQKRRVKVASAADADNITSFIEQMKAGSVDGNREVPVYSEKIFGTDSMNEYYARVSPQYVQTSTPRRFLIQREMFEAVKGSDRTEIHIEKSGQASTHGPSGTWITIASANISPHDLLQISSSVLANKSLSIDRAHLDTVMDVVGADDSSQYVTMLRLLIDDNGSLNNEEELEELRGHMKRAKWLDDEVVDLGLQRHPELGIDRAEIITALMSLLHGPLKEKDPNNFASTNTMIEMIGTSPHFVSMTGDIADLFMDRFRPDSKGGACSQPEFDERKSALTERIGAIHHEAMRNLLLKMIDAVGYTLRTNFYHENRYALSMRVDPRIMVGEDIDPAQMPYGVMFASGRNFIFFHNRFRDIARGGLRVVTPSSHEQYALESARVYNECYGLSWAQQLKNKDIPEGGSKAVCLVNTPNVREGGRYQEARKAIRAAVDAGILDLSVKDSVSELVDHLGKDEIIYLGPDEQVVPDDCDWICNRAAQRGYPAPMAFMSSKPLAGINHKEFGVTSEGVVTFLESALNNSLGINPREEPFSIKITGGPDGDVGGNLMKIMFREFGNNPNVLGIADGFGVAEDPEGLDGEELVRLVDASLPITEFNPSKLSKDGILMSATSDEGLARRNSMVFRIRSDCFVPAGGRPGTININNWKQFLLEDGVTPSSPLIVEGANIFTTPEARLKLFEHGKVAIVKDSSANKCGVVTSSCEVAASMLLTTEEFMDVKKELVSDVVSRLHEIARLEAELLFREYRNYPGALPHFSERISNAINLTTDCLTDRLQTINPGDPLWDELFPLIRDNLPKKLADVAWDRVPEKFPLQYQKNAIASTLAARMVYNEGIHLIETQPTNDLADRAIQYYIQSKDVQDLMKEFSDGEKLSPDSHDKIMKLLAKGGTRSSCDFF